MTLESIAKVRDFLVSSKYIVHAGGMVEDEQGNLVPYTNSKDALFNCYRLGNHICEFDFLVTTDGCVVCGHGWEDLTRPDGTASEERMSKQLFLSCKTRAGKSPLLLSDIIDFMRKHQDFYIVADVKDGNVEVCKLIADACPDLRDRFIIQIYHREEYEDIRKLGFHYIIYTLYRTTEEEREPSVLKEFAKTHELLGFTFWYYWPEKFPEWFAGMKDIGLPLFGHTLNDKEQIESCLKNGFCAMYTDRPDF